MLPFQLAYNQIQEESAISKDNFSDQTLRPPYLHDNSNMVIPVNNRKIWV